ncbi:hypothetical protein GCM10009087_36230 [Sphingomonas oligophenolica]|uniref:Alpha/beta hydrolase n=1 Tax=Sphingomonas oligophenolica TaxID=301154 RepID=A0ABU9Y977_9SPHN
MSDNGGQPRIVTRSFSGRQTAPAAQLPPESEAALRQFSAERLMAYGMAYADMVELRGRVAGGEIWEVVAAELAVTCLSPPEAVLARESRSTRANRLYRASALTRMQQMMMLTDTPERRAIFARAAALYVEAASLSGDRERVRIETPGGPLVGWLHGASIAAPVGATLVIGGVEGWAMDFAPMGTALAARGVAALLLDGPGQGETRLDHGHYLSRDWPSAYRAAVDHLQSRLPDVPLGIIGNSLGGSVVVRYAALDPRIRACCDNGGPATVTRARANATFFRKMVAHTGGKPDDEALAIWESVLPTGPDMPLSGPLLVVHGGLDPLIPDADAMSILEETVAPSRDMAIWSDGDHCVYNHADDKHDLIADWMAIQLAEAGLREPLSIPISRASA